MSTQPGQVQADTGPTDLAVLALICHTHHRWLHQHDQRLTRHPTTGWHLTSRNTITP